MSVPRQLQSRTNGKEMTTSCKRCQIETWTTYYRLATRWYLLICWWPWVTFGGHSNVLLQYLWNY